LNTALSPWENTPKTIPLMVVVLGSLYVYLVNGYVPLFADDLCRARPELSFTKAASSAWSEYLGWSGRLPVMFLNHLLLLR